MKSKLLPKHSLILGLALWLSCLSVGFAQMMFPQVTSQLDVTVTDGAGDEKHLSSINGVVPLVMVTQNQTVPITLQFSSDKAGTPVAATPLDGGRINRSDLVVLPTGRVIFTFEPSAAPGRYRLLVRTGIEEHLLEFYVVDPANPPFRTRPAHSIDAP